MLITWNPCKTVKDKIFILQTEEETKMKTFSFFLPLYLQVYTFGFLCSQFPFLFVKVEVIANFSRCELSCESVNFIFNFLMRNAILHNIVLFWKKSVFGIDVFNLNSMICFKSEESYYILSELMSSFVTKLYFSYCILQLFFRCLSCEFHRSK